MHGARDNVVPLYVTSLRQRLRHFLAKPSAELYLNNVKVEIGGSDALFACIDEKIERKYAYTRVTCADVGTLMISSLRSNS